jgi:hypothetical protein
MHLHCTRVRTMGPSVRVVERAGVGARNVLLRAKAASTGEGRSFQSVPLVDMSSWGTAFKTLPLKGRGFFLLLKGALWYLWHLN